MSVQNIARLVGISSDIYSSVEEVGPNKPALDKAIGDWIAQHTVDECVEQLKAAGVVGAPILDVAGIVADPTYAERGNIITVDDSELGPLRMQSVIPRLQNHGGDFWREAPSVGQDNDDVYGGA